jgi:hypothetical protein
MADGKGGHGNIDANDPKPIAFGVSAEANAQMSASHLE